MNLARIGVYLLLGARFTPTLARILREHLDQALEEPMPEESPSVPFIRRSEDQPPVWTRRAA